MNYLRFLIGRKWWGFTLVFLFFNVAGVWQMVEDGRIIPIIVIFIAILDTLLIVFSWHEYKLNYPDK